MNSVNCVDIFLISINALVDYSYNQTSVIERFCSRPSRFLTKKFEIFRSQISNKNFSNDEAEQTRMPHHAASIGFFYTICDVTELLHFFFTVSFLISAIFSKFFVLYSIVTFTVIDVLKIKHLKCLFCSFFHHLR